MPTRLQIAFVILLSVIGLRLIIRSFTSPSSKTVRRHPTNPPPPRGLPAFRQRLIAVGDLHGDIDNAQKVLRMAKLIGDDNAWSGNHDILVQTGDIVDRGTYALDIYQMMQRLRGEAETVGGKVVSILGNHEIMNAIGDWRYVTQPDIKRFGSSKKRQEALSINGWLGQEWLANYSTTALVSLGPYDFSPTLSFTHGSLRPSYPHLLPYPSAINDLGQSLLRKALTPPLAPPYPPNPYSGLPKSTTQEEAELYASGGPFWWRGLAEVEDEATVCAWAGELRQELGVRRIIGGHTPNFEKIVDRCNASIIIIDTGISSAYGGVLSALEIVYTLTLISPTHDHRQEPFVPLKMDDTSGEVSAAEELVTTKRLKPGRYLEREEVTAVYERRRDLIRVEQREVVL